jgi:hypothetical protein
MLDLWVDLPGDDVLLEVGLRPAENFLHKGIAEQPAIRTLSGRTNRVLLGIPQTTSILELWPANEPLAPEVAALQGEWDFLMVRLACSFVPDRGCTFVWARVAIELGMQDETLARSGAVVAFDLFPREVGERRNFKRSFNITPKLKFAFLEAAASIEMEKDTIRYDPQLFAAGLLTDTPIWTFNTPARPGVIGSKELFILLKKRRGSTVQARFVVGAEVRTAFGPVPLTRYEDESLLDRAYILTP